MMLRCCSGSLGRLLSPMRRRELILFVAGAMTAAHALRAQQKAMPVIGFLNSGSSGTFAPLIVAFRDCDYDFFTAARTQDDEAISCHVLASRASRSATYFFNSIVSRSATTTCVGPQKDRMEVALRSSSFSMSPPWTRSTMKRTRRET